MFKKIALGIATALAVTLAAGSMTTSAGAAEFSITIGNGYGGHVQNIHDRGHRGKGRRDYRRGYRDGGWNRGHGRWRDTRYDGRGHGKRHGRRDNCETVKKIIIFEDRYGQRHREVRRFRRCGWGRR